MKINLFAVSTSLLLLFGIQEAFSGTIRSKVGAHPSVGISERILDKAYNDASSVLEKDDSEPDVSCQGVRFDSSTGSNLKDRNLISTIEDEDDYEIAASKGYKLYFMSRINNCGSIVNNPTIRGCKKNDGRIYVRYPIRSMETTIAHEFGHLKGLVHGSHDPKFNWRIMYYKNHRNRKGVSADECIKLTGTIGGDFADLEDETTVLESSNLSPPNIDLDFEEFLSDGWIDEIPKDEILSLEVPDVDRALEVIKNLEEEDKFYNSLIILGLRGGKHSIQVLIESYNKLIQRNEPSYQEAFLLLPMIIGMVTGRTQSVDGLNFLDSMSVSRNLEVEAEQTNVSPQILRENFLIGRAYGGNLEETDGYSSLQNIQVMGEVGSFTFELRSKFERSLLKLNNQVKTNGVIESFQ